MAKNLKLKAARVQLDLSQEALAERVKQHVKAHIGVSVVPKPVDMGELPRSEKKSTRIFDNRY